MSSYPTINVKLLLTLNFDQPNRPQGFFLLVPGGIADIAQVPDLTTGGFTVRGKEKLDQYITLDFAEYRSID